MNKRRFFYSLPIILLLIVVTAGWFTTDYLGNKARQEIIGESQASLLTLSIHIFSSLHYFEGAVKSLAGSPWIVPVLLSKGERDIEQANSVLDRYNSALNASVSYLMDANGMTMASSNRNDPDSFVGNSYHFRPYFQKASEGRPYRYFALGTVSGKRGFYASYPVQNRSGKVLGVVTIKKDLDEMETFFSKYPFCFLISPEGIIFLSSSPAMVLKSLWPLDKSVQGKLITSQQFGNKPFESVMKKEIADGTEVAFEGSDYFVSRKVIDSDGWSILLLTPMDRIRNYKLIGILATVSVCGLIIFFLSVIYLTDRSREAIRQSEESKRLLLHAAGDGIFGIDTTGQVTFVNPAARRMLGFSEEDMLGQGVHNLIHHSHKDGSNYPLVDCPMYDSYTKAAHRNVTDEVLWRKDGSNFLVEYSSTPIIEDGKNMGAVVTFKDITDRKRMEEEILALSITDQLTGLHNRRGFLSLAAQQLKLAERNKSGMLLFFADLDGLKWINDTLGHEEGDQALIEAATVFKETFRTSDIIARLGGDEYAALAVNITEENSEIFTARLQSLTDTRNNQENRRYRLSISVGCSCYDPEHPCSIEELMASADRLMYEHKQKKKSLLLQGASLQAGFNDL